MTREAVAEIMRKRILDSAYSPGERLPTAEALAEELGASYVTVLRGMDSLREEGFVVSHRRTGAFVAEHPPNHFECVMVFPMREDPAALAEHPFWHMLCAEAPKSNRSTAPWRIRPWFLEDDPTREGDLILSKDHEEVLLSGAIAGLIFPFNPKHLCGTPIMDQPGIARVTVDRVALPGVSRVTPDHVALIGGALDRVKAVGRERVAIVICKGLLDRSELSGGEKRLRKEVSSRGLQMRPYDLYESDLPVDATSLRRYVHMLLDRPVAERPDALILVDDHFVDAATAGVIDAGVSVPDDLFVLSYCNFPHRPKSPIPVSRFGYDVRDLLRQFVTAIERQHKDGHVSHKRLQPVFEDDVS